MKHLDHGKQNPFLLPTKHVYLLSGVVFAGNVAVLVALVLGAAENGDTLARVAEAAERAAPEKPAEPPPCPQEASPGRPSTEKTLRVSVPGEWQWRGCRADGSGEIEILFAAGP